ncbi:MAG: SH3 domain-containing protein [Bdellovibrionota bacterium]
METFADKFAKGDFPNAQLELEKVKENISPGLWHFNMGTVKAKLMNPAEARFHFLEARMNGFTDEQLTQNLDLIENQLEVKTLEKPLGAQDFAMKAGMWGQNGLFTMLSLLVLVIGMIILKKERKYSILILTLTLAAIPFGLQFWVKSWDKYITVAAHEVREGPSTIFGSRGELPPGILVVTRRPGDWVEITYPSRFRGWIKNVGLKELE